MLGYVARLGFVSKVIVLFFVRLLTINNNVGASDGRCSYYNSTLDCQNLTLPFFLVEIREWFTENSDTKRFRLSESRIEYSRSGPVSIPWCSGLQSVILTNITYYDDDGTVRRLPLHDLIVNIKHNLTELVVTECNLQELTRFDLYGLSRLETLDLSRNNISSISVLSLLPHLTSDSFYFNLAHNRLITFEWGLLQPVAPRITELGLNNNSIESVTMMPYLKGMSLPNLAAFWLHQNNLTGSGIAKDILNTIPANIQLISVGDSPLQLCCDCCQFSSFAQWIDENKHNLATAKMKESCIFRNFTKAVWLHDMSDTYNEVFSGLADCTPGTTYTTNQSFNATVITEFSSTISYNSSSNSLIVRQINLAAVFAPLVSALISVVALFIVCRSLLARGYVKHQRTCPWFILLRKPTYVSRRYTRNLNGSLKHDVSYSNYGAVPSKYVVPKWRISINDERVLGIGYFGKVYLGELQQSTNSNKIVAVKTWKNADAARLRDEFYAEMTTMVRIGQHENIVTLLGVCDELEMYLILEYCSNGALDKFLRRSRPRSSVLRAQTAPLNNRKLNDYVADLEFSKPTSPEDLKESQNIIIVEANLIRFCLQICRGMTFISSIGIIHRDLAARNVLLDGEMNAKIADFGMAREDTEYILARQNVPLPVKWMAPESIKNKGFSIKSDVWSYGIVMWEMFSFGDIPYVNECSPQTPETFYEYLQSGSRLVRPADICDTLFQLMTSCWEWKPENRLTFEEILSDIEGLCHVGTQNNYIICAKAD